MKMRNEDHSIIQCVIKENVTCYDMLKWLFQGNTAHRPTVATGGAGYGIDILWVQLHGLTDADIRANDWVLTIPPSRVKLIKIKRPQKGDHCDRLEFIGTVDERCND